MRVLSKISAILLAIVSFHFLAAPSWGADCNLNGVEDAVDVTPGAISFGAGVTINLTNFSAGDRVIKVKSEIHEFCSVGRFGYHCDRTPVVYVAVATADSKLRLYDLDFNTDGSLYAQRSFLFTNRGTNINIPGVTDAAFGDIDHDGISDLAFASFGTVFLFRNNNSGSFSRVTGLSGITDAVKVLIADYNGDLQADIIWNTELKNAPDHSQYSTHNVTYQQIDNPLQFSGGGQISVPADNLGKSSEDFPYTLAAVDLSNDYSDDVVLLNGGMFAPGLRITTGLPTFAPSYYGGHFVKTPTAFGDIDGDGFKEGIYGDLAATSFLLMRTGAEAGGYDPTFINPPVSTISIGRAIGVPFAAADFNGDSRDDIATRQSSSKQSLNVIRVFPNLGQSKLGTPKVLEVAVASGWEAHAVNISDDSLTDILTVNPSTGELVFRKNQTTLPNSLDRNVNKRPDSCDHAVAGDFDGDFLTDHTIVREDTRGGVTYLQWLTRPGDSTDDSAQLSDPNVYVYGLKGDLPYAADWDGDGSFDPGVIRTTRSGMLWFSPLPTGSDEVVSWGKQGDVPLSGYYDGDNTADRVVVRRNRTKLYWYIRLSSGAPLDAIQWGKTGDTPFAADLDGDGIDELILARKEFGGITWYPRNLAGAAFAPLQWGLTGDVLLRPIDYDGDNKADFAVSRGEQIYVFQSTVLNGLVLQNTGIGNGVPILGNFTRGSRARQGFYRAAPGYVSFHGFFREGQMSGGVGYGLSGDSFIRPDGTAIKQ